VRHNRRVTEAIPTTDIRLYDTRRRAVVPLEPIEPGRVGIYTCGPTVYGPQHLGNMRSQLLPDLLRRVLMAAGYDVRFVTNITDVGHLVSDADEGDDKVEAAAAASGASVEEIIARWTDQWATDRRRLGCLEPDSVPRATEHIAEQIEMIRALEEKGHTYVIDDGVYFDTSTFPRYAEFAHLKLDDLEATGRVENIANKRHPADFALWKFSPTDHKRLQEWDSPWGVGFPGWHIECSAMSVKELGERFDIHTGGVDHIRVHHTNEVAQTECALGVHPWVSIWMHNEFLDIGGEKISKSKGHVLLVDTLVEQGIEPLAFRYFFLQAHYRQQQQFTFDHVRAADKALRRLTHHAVVARDSVGGDATAGDPARTGPIREAFWAALADDLNAPKALAVVSSVVRDGSLTAADRWSLLADFDRALGFGLATAEDPERAAVVDAADLEAEMAELLARREAARRERDFATADALRDEIGQRGFDIVDTPEGPTLRRR
jgi:cysteinyl-tRNA synthetase